MVHLRYARWDLTRVDLVDPHTGAVLCPITPLDNPPNAERARRPRAPSVVDLSPLPPAGMAPLLTQLLADYAGHRLATGLSACPHFPRRTGPRVNTKLLALYGLEVAPLHDRGAHRGDPCAARLEHFCWRIRAGADRRGWLRDDPR